MSNPISYMSGAAWLQQDRVSQEESSYQDSIIRESNFDPIVMMTMLHFISPSNEVDTEGAISAKWLTDEVRHITSTLFYTEQSVIWSGFRLNSAGNIITDAAGVEKIREILSPAEFDTIVARCIGHGGIHRISKKFSIEGFVTSDHLIPQCVRKELFKQSCFQSVSANRLPAISIPDGIHKTLLTTIDHIFQTQIYHLCSAGKYDEAIYKCLGDYQDKGIKLTDIKGGIVEYLKWFVKGRYFDKVVANNILSSVGLVPVFTV